MNFLRATPRRVIVGLIRGYQGLRRDHLSPCRFVPSCSEYAAEAVQSRGALVGSVLAARRILRCNPFGGRGFDPVPVRR